MLRLGSGRPGATGRRWAARFKGGQWGASTKTLLEMILVSNHLSLLENTESSGIHSVAYVPQAALFDVYRIVAVVTLSSTYVA